MNQLVLSAAGASKLSILTFAAAAVLAIAAFAQHAPTPKNE
jgi:hypothetical protein